MTYTGKTLHSFQGKEIGTITDVIATETDSAPAWVTVKVGLLRREHLVPVSTIDEQAGLLTTTLDEDLIKHAPVVHNHVSPSSTELEMLRAHFGLPQYSIDGPSIDRIDDVGNN